MLGYDTSGAYYLLPSRAFEIAIGALASQVPASLAGGKWQSGLGAVLVVSALIVIDDNKSFTGAWALLPCVGAALVCAFPLGWAGRGLSFRPLAGIGRISYSLHLVHWPTIFFFDRLYAGANPWLRAVVTVAISFGVAFGSYRLIELPFSGSRFGLKRPHFILAAAVSASVAMATVVIAIALTGGMAWRVSGRLEALSQYQNYDFAQQFNIKCFMDFGMTISQLDKQACLPTGNNVIFGWDGSGLAQYSSALNQFFDAHGLRFAQITGSGCPPEIGAAPPGRPACPDINRFAWSTIISSPPRVVLMGSFWPDDGMKRLDDTLTQLGAAGIPAIVVGQLPLFETSVPKELISRSLAGNPDRMSDGDLRAEYIAPKDRAIGDIVAKHSNAVYVDALNFLCPALRCPLEIDGDIPYRFDIFHATAQAATDDVSILGPAIMEALQKFPAGPTTRLPPANESYAPPF